MLYTIMERGKKKRKKRKHDTSKDASIQLDSAFISIKKISSVKSEIHQKFY
jgi:hypothetical protein